MVRRLALAVVLLAMVLLIAPETARTTAVEPGRDLPNRGTVEQGYASAYDPGVMEAVVVHRERHDIWRNEPPRDLQDVDGYIAAMDCSRVGQVTTMYGPDGRAYSVLVADCAGADGPPDRFSRRRIIAELDGRLWAELTATHGTPLAIGLR